MTRIRLVVALLALLVVLPALAAPTRTYVVVGTGQRLCYDATGQSNWPQPGGPLYGQDAQNPSVAPAYRDNPDQTVTDLNTGLVWVRARGTKVTWDDAMAGASRCRVGGHADWRMPTIKELYSLIQFDGGGFHLTEAASAPFLDTRFFEFRYGSTAAGERAIDCQDWSATQYLGTTMGGQATVFGVNFADGRIKGYPKLRGRQGTVNRLYARYVRGNPKYGINDYRDNGDGTVTDCATGLMWSRNDSGVGMDWGAALAWVQAKNRAAWLGHRDWRLPHAKELQSIVDYGRAPAAVDPRRRGPALDPIFHITRLASGEYPYFWSATSHLDGPVQAMGRSAVYVCFGRSLGIMRSPGDGLPSLLDVHGAGAQRSDPKAGNPVDFPYGRGPQGDDIRIHNFVRLVRNAD